MKLTIGKLLAGMLLASTFTASSLADEAAQSDQMRSMMLEMMRSNSEQQCQNTEQLACMGISSSDCIEFVDDMIGQCLEPVIMETLDLSNIDSAAMEQRIKACSEDVMEKHDIDAERAEACGG